MRIRALIDCRLGGTTGHVVPIARGETADVAEAVADEGLQKGIVEPADRRPARVAGGPKPTEMPSGAPPAAQAAVETAGTVGDPTPNAADPVVDQLVAILKDIVASGPEEAALRADGMPRTGTVRRAGADFDFSEEQLEDAWDRVKQQGA